MTAVPVVSDDTVVGVLGVREVRRLRRIAGRRRGSRRSWSSRRGCGSSRPDEPLRRRSSGSSERVSTACRWSRTASLRRDAHATGGREAGPRTRPAAGDGAERPGDAGPAPSAPSRGRAAPHVEAARRRRPRGGPGSDRPESGVADRRASAACSPTRSWSDVDLPPWDNSAMDGYAIRAADLAGATETRRSVCASPVTSRPACAPNERVERGTAVRIATGAPDPDGRRCGRPGGAHDARRRGWATGRAGGRDAAGPLPAAILVHRAVAAGRRSAARQRPPRWRRVLEAGSAVRRPRSPSPRGPASAPHGSAPAHRRRARDRRRGPCRRAAARRRRHPGRERAGAHGARRRRAGGEPLDLGIAADRLDDVRARLCAGLAERRRCDRRLGRRLGRSVRRRPGGLRGDRRRIDLWRVAVQPGKPFAFGTTRRAAGWPARAVLLFGLPGQPRLDAS